MEFLNSSQIVIVLNVILSSNFFPFKGSSMFREVSGRSRETLAVLLPPQRPLRGRPRPRRKQLPSLRQVLLKSSLPR